MDRSDRSRSPVGRSSFEETERLREAYRKIRTAKRGGKIHKRRLKSICARLLEHLIRLIDLVLQEFSVGNRGHGDPSASYYRNRKQQAADRLEEVRQGWLPRRDQYILEFSQYEELESELASPIALTSDSEEEEAQVAEPEGIWREETSTASGSRDRQTSRVPQQPPYPPPRVVDSIRRATVTSSNPLLRPRAPAPVLQPRFSDERVDLNLLQSAGVEFSGNLTHRIKGIIVSLDWHQVCDTIRVSKFQTLRCDNRGHYYLLDPLKQQLLALRNIANQVAGIGGQPVTVAIVSYTHSRTYTNLVLGLLPLEASVIDISITTRARVGRGGKLWVLRQIADPSAKIWHADDSKEIVTEITSQATVDNAASAKVAAIRVPKHWRSQREIQVHWYSNVLDALSLLIETWRAEANRR